MTNPPSVGESLANDIINRIEELLLHADQQGEAIEVNPHRERLFELFVMADAAGFLTEDADQDLTSDGVARELAIRWKLANDAGDGPPQLSKLPPALLAKMRVMWSFMRMWMEWTYAWKRWSEFHDSPSQPSEVDDKSN